MTSKYYRPESTDLALPKLEGVSITHDEAMAIAERLDMFELQKEQIASLTILLKGIETTLGHYASIADAVDETGALLVKPQDIAALTKTAMSLHKEIRTIRDSNVFKKAIKQSEDQSISKIKQLLSQ